MSKMCIWFILLILSYLNGVSISLVYSFTHKFGEPFCYCIYDKNSYSTCINLRKILYLYIPGHNAVILKNFMTDIQILQI